MDELKTYSLEEFVDMAKAELELYRKEWKDSNEFHRQPHTVQEWLRSLSNYFSF